MDRVKAQSLEKKIFGKTILGYTIAKLLDNGKSAAVFKAQKNDIEYAVKIFDNELVERFGHEIQIKRIEQEITLKEHTTSNLVKILDGGTTIIDGENYYFLVMEFITGMNLKNFIKHKSYDEVFIKKTLITLLSTTNALLKGNIVHRDIKPENIMVDENGEIILMDLGVLKLIGAKSFSDEEEKQFVGTLRYAPPEFLTRNESDSIDGWKAVNLYQIGATLHDLIMNTELFLDKIPYSNLVIAIKDDPPKISNSRFSFELQQLVRNMLSKDWKTRLTLCKDETIIAVCEKKDEPKNLLEKNIDAVLKSRLEHQAKFDEIEKLQKTKTEIRQNQQEIGKKLLTLIDECFASLQKRNIFNNLAKSNDFRFDRDFHIGTDILIQNVLFELSGDLKMGFPRSLFILVRMKTNTLMLTEIELLGIFPFAVAKANINEPAQILKQVAKNRNPYNTHVAELDLLAIFNGVAEFDAGFRDFIIDKLVQLIGKSLVAVDKIVTDEIAWQIHLATTNHRMYSRMGASQRDILIDAL